MADAPGVMVVGSVHTDFVAAAARLPVPGETLPGHRFGEFPGGKGGNQAIAAAQAGSRTVFVGRVGRDERGRRLRAALAAKGVEIAWLGEDATTATGASAVLVGAAGDYASIIVPGASGRLSAKEIEAARLAFAASRVVVGQLEIDPAITLAALRLGKRLGLTTVLNAAPAPADAAALPAGFWREVDLLVANRVEAAMLLACQPDAAGEDGGAADLAQRFGLPAVLVTLGPAGAAAAEGGNVWHEVGFPVGAVDAIGAGDAFVGYLAAALAAGATLAEAVRRANAAGALAVTRPGAYDAAPPAAAVETFMASMAAGDRTHPTR